ncbi:5-formyltetrahydrofolate cyclo-ligase [Falsibacillus albus]|uniref:5-formyltetrahydrofolate cyclo-ligase n=2 Tax=Falsibacillus albus TaxID=2478915 RepID=A0A3L7K5I2_9BACI|nr:5-formyltetrahydrofolate cyclo-ligase [Falsibacillus albus]
MNKKKQIRKKMKSSLEELEKLVYEQSSYLISKRLFELEDWRNANTIGITISNGTEVDTWQIIRRAWTDGKRIVVPKCLTESKELLFKQITDFTQLEKVFFGLYEPKAEQEAIDKHQIDLLIVPGLAFMKDGYRLGFGGGYYDRFLADYKGNTVSLAFQRQLVESLPIEDFDKPVKKIITDQEVVVCHA